MKTNMEMLCGPVLIALIQSCLLGAVTEGKHTGRKYDGCTLLTLRRLMSYIYGAPILDVSRSHTTTQHSR